MRINTLSQAATDGDRLQMRLLRGQLVADTRPGEFDIPGLTEIFFQGYLRTAFAG